MARGFAYKQRKGLFTAASLEAAKAYDPYRLDAALEVSLKYSGALAGWATLESVTDTCFQQVAETGFSAAGRH